MGQDMSHYDYEDVLRVRHENDKAVKILKSLEWAGVTPSGDRYCPICMALEGLEEHKKDCWFYENK
jgi:hypothetical protein